MKKILINLLSILLFQKLFKNIFLKFLKKNNFQFFSNRFFNKLFYRILRSKMSSIKGSEEYKSIDTYLYHCDSKEFTELLKKKYLDNLPNPGKVYDELNPIKEVDYNINKLDYKNIQFAKVFKCYDYVKKISLSNSSQDIVLGQVGSASGHDIIWCIKNTSIKNYISSDISQSALEYQSKKIFKDIIEKNKARIEFQKLSCVELAKLFSEKRFENKIKIILGKGSLQYEPPYEILNFFNIISKMKNLYLAISQPLDTFFLKDVSSEFFLSSYRKSFSFNHNYRLINRLRGIEELDYEETHFDDTTNVNLLSKTR